MIQGGEGGKGTGKGGRERHVINPPGRTREEEGPHSPPPKKGKTSENKKKWKERRGKEMGKV